MSCQTEIKFLIFNVDKDRVLTHCYRQFLINNPNENSKQVIEALALIGGFNNIRFPMRVNIKKDFVSSLVDANKADRFVEEKSLALFLRLIDETDGSDWAVVRISCE